MEKFPCLRDTEKLTAGLQAELSSAVIVCACLLAANLALYIYMGCCLHKIQRLYQPPPQQVAPAAVQDGNFVLISPE